MFAKWHGAESLSLNIDIRAEEATLLLCLVEVEDSLTLPVFVVVSMYFVPACSRIVTCLQ